MSNEIILTQKEIDDGRAPAHMHCKTVERNGEDCYVFYGQTGDGQQVRIPAPREIKKDKKKSKFK